MNHNKPEAPQLPPLDCDLSDHTKHVLEHQLDCRERQLLSALTALAESQGEVERHLTKAFNAEGLAVYQQRRAEKAEAELFQTRENLVIVRMQDYAELSAPDAAYKLYSLWQDALHKSHEAHPENRRIAELEAELTTLRTLLRSYQPKEEGLEKVVRLEVSEGE